MKFRTSPVGVAATAAGALLLVVALVVAFVQAAPAKAQESMFVGFSDRGTSENFYQVRSEASGESEIAYCMNIRSAQPPKEDSRDIELPKSRVSTPREPSAPIFTATAARIWTTTS